MTDLSKSELEIDKSVLEFNKYACKMQTKFANLDEIKAVIIVNLAHYHGNEGFFASGT